jgi:hypothetical protein
MLRLHHAIGKWGVLGLGSVTLAVLGRWGWLVLQSGVGTG